MWGSLRLLDDAALHRLSGAAFDLLGQIGMRVEHPALLAALREHGCPVDESARRARFPAPVLEETLAHYGGAPTETLAIPSPRGPLRVGTWGVQPHFLEWPGGERRLAGEADLVLLTKMADALPEVATVGLPVVNCDAPQRVEPILSRALVMKHTCKPWSGSEVIHADNVRYLVELAAIAAGGQPADPGVASCNFVIAPLRLEARACACVLEKFRFDIPFVAGTMVISGLSGPSTLAGAVALALAEILGCWTIARCLRPDLPVGAILCTGSLDMRTARANFASPEAVLQDLTACEIARRVWGVSGVGSAACYVDAKTPGIQATYEKLFKLLAGFPFTGNLGDPGGLLSAGEDYCPTQHMLDIEMTQSLHRFTRKYEVTAETLALEVIAAVEGTPGKTFLDHPHTLEHFHGETWFPDLFDRRIWQGSTTERDAERRLLARAEEKWRAAVARYTPPEIPDDYLRAIADVVRRAKRDLLGV